MGRRYVFWRTPAGKPYRGDDDKHAPVELLAEMGKCAAINDEGNPQWDGPRVHRLETAIRGTYAMLDPDGLEVNDTDAWRIVWSAMGSLVKRSGGRSPIAARDVVKEADSLAAKHFRKTKADYVLVSSLSVSSFPGKCLKIRDCEIRPIKSRGRRYPYPAVVRNQTSRATIGKHVASTGYQMVRVKTRGRTIHEATATALAALDLLRGLWTLAATYRSWSITVGSIQQKSLGVIHKGPVHTLHLLDGKAVGDTYWVDLDFTEDRKLFTPSKGWSEIEEYRRWATRRLYRLPFRRDVEDVIIRYANALDHTNLDVAFLQMWGILEKLTDTVGANYRETIRRAVWFFSDRHLAEEILESLRIRRNQYVHAAKSADDRDQITYMVKNFVDPHLHELIRNDFKVETLEEYGKYLALPTNIATLEKGEQQMRRAARLLKK